jgi:MiaB-like tRNA modifying enzyme
MKFYIETYGCTANLGNSQELARALQEMGHIPSSLPEADAVIVNTCAVTEKTERKILRRLSLLQGDRLIVAGCLATARPESVSRISCRERLGILNRDLGARISEIFAGTSIIGLSPGISSGTPPQAGLCGIVNVAEGCNGSCSYCIVKNARGRLRSQSLQVLVEEVKRQVALGTAEVQICAQDTAAYGSDLGSDLAQLLERLAGIPGDFMLRVGMMNPNSALLIQEKLLKAFQSPKVYRFLHIPVQSGSDRILQSMGRGYSSEGFMQVARAFRSAFPDITIITDVIVGFPGESEEDFKETLNLMKVLQPDKINITRFSARPGTMAAQLYDMPDRIKKDRSRELTSLWLEIAAERNQRYVGEVLEARITELGRDGTMKARAKNYLGLVVKGCPERVSSIKVLVTEFNPFYVSGRAVIY